MDKEDAKTLYCARCRLKPAIYVCSKCEPFVNFCLQCDNYVHSMSSKKNHKREVIQTSLHQCQLEKEGKQAENNRSNQSNLSHRSNLSKEEEKSYEKRENEREREKEREGGQEKEKERENNRSFNDYKDYSEGRTQFRQLNASKYLNEENSVGRYYQTHYKSDLHNISIDRPNPTNTNLNNQTNSFQTVDVNHDNYVRRPHLSNAASPIQYHSKLNNNMSVSMNKDKDESFNRGYNTVNTSLVGSNSKDYINEIKNLYEKEKQDLLYRNSTLQSNLDQVKSTLSEKISTLEFKLEETNKKSKLNEQIMEDEFNLHMKRILNEKDMEIKNLHYKIDDLEKSNKDLMDKLNESLRDNADVKNYYKNVINDMEYDYKMKDKEYLDLKASFENKMNFYTSNFEDEKVKLIKNYEDNFEKMSKAHKESKEKLNSIIYQREMDLKSVLDKNKEEDEKYLATISELRKNLAERVNEIDNLKSRITQHENEIAVLQRTLEKNKKETNYILNEVKVLEGENKKHQQENQELKINSEKMHGMLYGKIANKKPNSSSSNLTNASVPASNASNGANAKEQKNTTKK